MFTNFQYILCVHLRQYEKSPFKAMSACCLVCSFHLWSFCQPADCSELTSPVGCIPRFSPCLHTTFRWQLGELVHWTFCFCLISRITKRRLMSPVNVVIVKWPSDTCRLWSRCRQFHWLVYLMTRLCSWYVTLGVSRVWYRGIVHAFNFLVYCLVVHSVVLAIDFAFSYSYMCWLLVIIR